MGFKRLMVLGAAASALAFTGCQDRRGGDDTAAGGAEDQTQPATGGSGKVDSTIPGGSETIGGVPQDERPGTELGGSGSSGGSINDTGGSGSTGGSLDDQGTSEPLDQDGTGGSGAINDQGTSEPLDPSDVGSGTTGDDGQEGRR